MPVDAGVMAFDSSGGNLLASSAARASIYGGDVFNVGSPGSEATTIIVNSVGLSCDPLDGQFVEIARGASMGASGFAPLPFEGMQDPARYVLVQDNGSASSTHAITAASSPIDLVAVYRVNYLFARLA